MSLNEYSIGLIILSLFQNKPKVFIPMPPMSAENYKIEIIKKLERFKNAKEWSDFIEPLDSLCATFKSNKSGFVPCIPQLVKRLNQLMNPALPAGIHMKTIECYHAIFDSIGQSNFQESFDALTIGLFGFSLHCRILVANEYLNLLEKVIMKLGSSVENFSKNIILGILPFLESESSEFYNRAYLLLISFINQISQKAFYSALWRNFIDYPDLRVCILNFMNNYKLVVVTNYSLVTHAMCSGLKDNNSFIIRSILEMSNRDFPYVVENEKPEIKQSASLSPSISLNESDSNENKNLVSLPNETNNSQFQVVKEDSSLNIEENKLQQDSTQSVISNNEQKLETQRIKDLVSESTSDSTLVEIQNEKEKCNLNLIHHILGIFLMKEAGINKRAYKWLNLGDQISEEDIDYLEKGLRTYLDGSEANLCIFYKIINSLSDKENLASYLIDRLIVDALRATININSKNDSFANIKKHAKIFLTLSLDDFYSSMYTKLSKTFEITSEISNGYEELEIESESEVNSSFSDDLTFKVYNTMSNTNSNLADELVKLILYSIETLEVINSNAETIHIPLLCHLIIKNKKKINFFSLTRFFKLFCEKSIQNKTVESREIHSNQIDTFYEKVNSTEILDFNLIGAVARELGKMDIYKESKLDSMYWTKSNLVEQDGILIWSEVKDIEFFIRNCGGYFNFEEKDVDIIRHFINTFGYKDFDPSFLKIFCRYLCFNYKYIDMIRKLSSFLDKSLLYINLWNDFIISKNPKFFIHFPEDELLSVIHSVFPTTNLEDMCLFLSETLHYGKFIGILFRTATVADPDSSSFVSLILDLADPLPIIKYILETFYHQQEKIDDFQCKSAILYILQILIDSKPFEEFCREKRKIGVSNLGDLDIAESISKVIVEIVTSESIKNHEILDFKKNIARFSAILDLNGHLLRDKAKKVNNPEIIDNHLDSGIDDICSNPNLFTDKKAKEKSNATNLVENTGIDVIEFDSVSTASEFNDEFFYQEDPTKRKILFDNHPVVDFDSIESAASNLIERHSIHLKKEMIYKLGFDCLYKMHKKDIPVIVTDTNGIKSVICESKNDFYVLKRSVFLVKEDFKFIYNNYMHFYKLILAEIAQMDISNKFFIFLSDPNSECSVEIFTEAFAYFTQIPSIKMEDLYLKAHALMTNRTKKGGHLFRKFRNTYKRVSLQKSKGKSVNEDSSSQNTLQFSFKNAYDVEKMASFFPQKTELPILVMLTNENLQAVLTLADILYKKNPSLFTSTFFHGEDSFFLFSILPFKDELFRKLLVIYKQAKFPLKVLHIFLENISNESRELVIKAETDFIRSNFGIGEQDSSSQKFIVELFMNQSPSDLSRLVLLHLLSQYELKIDQVVRLSYNFDIEITLMKKLVKIPMRDNSLITSFKNCCYNLLQSRTYREKALQIIYCYLKNNPNCKIFIDQFVIHFSRNFFAFGLLTKKKILEIISASSYFDPFLAIENAFSGMDSSFFMSAQSEELLKINSLKKIAFLILSQPRNKYSTMADNFVVLINSYINSTSDIKYEIIRLCSVLMFKIDNHYLITLYPILVADFMTAVNLKDIRVLGEIFKFVDLSIWLNSSIFDFKALFFENHQFREQLVNKLFTEEYQDRPIDMNAKKLPNFITRSFQQFTQWSDFSYFLSAMPKYYRYKENCLIENDYDAVEENLAESFLDSK